MTLEAYVKFRLGKRIKFIPIQESKELLEDIYKEMEIHGYKHTDIYVAINNVVLTNIRKLKVKQKEQMKTLEEK